MRENSLILSVYKTMGYGYLGESLTLENIQKATGSTFTQADLKYIQEKILPTVCTMSYDSAILKLSEAEEGSKSKPKDKKKASVSSSINRNKKTGDQQDLFSKKEVGTNKPKGEEKNKETNEKKVNPNQGELDFANSGKKEGDQQDLFGSHEIPKGSQVSKSEEIGTATLEKDPNQPELDLPTKDEWGKPTQINVSPSSVKNKTQSRVDQAKSIVANAASTQGSASYGATPMPTSSEKGTTQKELNSDTPKGEVEKGTEDDQDNLDKKDEVTSDQDELDSAFEEDLYNVIQSALKELIIPKKESLPDLDSKEPDVDRDTENNALKHLDSLSTESLSTISFTSIMEAVNFGSPKLVEEKIRKKLEKDVKDNPETPELDDDQAEQVIIHTVAPVILEHFQSTPKLVKKGYFAGLKKDEALNKIVKALIKKPENINMVKESWKNLHDTIHKGNTGNTEYNNAVIEPLFSKFILKQIPSSFNSTLLADTVKNNPTGDLDSTIKDLVESFFVVKTERDALFNRSLKDLVSKYNSISSTKIDSSQVVDDLKMRTESEFFDSDSSLFSITQKLNQLYLDAKHPKQKGLRADNLAALKQIESSVGVTNDSDDLTVYDIQDHLLKLAKSRSPLLDSARNGDGVKCAVDIYNHYRNSKELTKQDIKLFKAIAGKSRLLGVSPSNQKFAIAPNGVILSYKDYRKKYNTTFWSKVKHRLNKNIGESYEETLNFVLTESLLEDMVVSNDPTAPELSQISGVDVIKKTDASLEEASSPNYVRDYKQEGKYQKRRDQVNSCLG